MESGLLNVVNLFQQRILKKWFCSLADNKLFDLYLKQVVNVAKGIVLNEDLPDCLMIHLREANLHLLNA